MERELLSAVYSSREAYDTAKQFLDVAELSEQGKILYNKAAAFYEKDQTAGKVETGIVLSQLEREVPKHFDMFRRIIDGMTTTVISIPNVMEELLALKKHQSAMQLSSALLEGNNAKIKELIDLYQQYDAGQLSTEQVEQQVFIGQPVSELITSFDMSNLIRIYPLAFNQHLDGGVPQQTHIVLYALPEMGKSMFAINMAAGFCKDGHKTLYIGNEDPAASMLMRFVSRFSEMPKMDILRDPDRAQAIAVDRGYENLIFASLPSGTVPEIERLIKTYKPNTVIVDQIRHLKFRGVDGEVAQLSAAGKEMRRLGKKYNTLMVSVTQAATSATNKLVLEQDDVYMSNTSIPGDADILLGIGGNAQYLAGNRRMLSPCKNKINNNHASLVVGVEPQISRVISL